MLYFIIALMATSLGALVGLGGGVIIKPVLDVVSPYSLETVGLLSSLAVFSMAVLSLLLNLRKGFLINKQLVIVSIGAIIGGTLGKFALRPFIHMIGDTTTASAIQSFILVFLLLMVLIKSIFIKKSLDIMNLYLIAAVGLLLGFTSSFLGIGGGPINVAVCMVLFPISINQAAVYSIFIILLSQGAKLTSVLLNGEFSRLEPSVALMLIIGGLLGAWIGSRLSKVVPGKLKAWVFNVAVVLILLFNVYVGLDALFKTMIC